MSDREVRENLSEPHPHPSHSISRITFHVSHLSPASNTRLFYAFMRIAVLLCCLYRIQSFFSRAQLQRPHVCFLSTTTVEDAVLNFTDQLLLLQSETTSRQELLTQAKKEFQEDIRLCQESSLVIESTTQTNRHIPCKAIYTADQYRLAVQSSHAVFDFATLQFIRDTASTHWQSCTKSSRFTFQRPGNYEVHVSDLVLILPAVNQALETTIYPLIRQEFLMASSDDKTSSLCVYDALVIRYNASETTLAAGQPFHRDFGLVSVNIMLNAASDFAGGGTCLENQLRSTQPSTLDAIQPLIPVSPGYCLAHWSSERHAGCGITEGIRDILVLFVSAMSPPYAQLLAGKLKYAPDARMAHQRLAVEYAPSDGEAWQFLGKALMGYADEKKDDANTINVLHHAQKSLEIAAWLTPQDYRVYSNLALVQKRVGDFVGAEQSFQKAYNILCVFERANCDVMRDLDALALNFGLHLAWQDRFQEACKVLQRLVREGDIDERFSSMYEDGRRLYYFCHERQEHTSNLHCT